MNPINYRQNLITAKLNQLNTASKTEQTVEQKKVDRNSSDLINKFLENQAKINISLYLKI